MSANCRYFKFPDENASCSRNRACSLLIPDPGRVPLPSFLCCKSHCPRTGGHHCAQNARRRTRSRYGNETEMRHQSVMMIMDIPSSEGDTILSELRHAWLLRGENGSLERLKDGQEEDIWTTFRLTAKNGIRIQALKDTIRLRPQSAIARHRILTTDLPIRGILRYISSR